MQFNILNHEIIMTFQLTHYAPSRQKKSLRAFLLILTLFAAPVNATVIDFEDLAGQKIDPSYSKDGFIFSSDGIDFYPFSVVSDQGSTAILDGLSDFGGSAYLTRGDNKPFNLLSIDLTWVGGGCGKGCISNEATLIGQLSGGGTVSQDIKGDLLKGFQKFNITGFTNVVRVYFPDTPKGFNQIELDNINVSVPTSVPLSDIVYPTLHAFKLLGGTNQPVFDVTDNVTKKLQFDVDVSDDLSGVRDVIIDFKSKSGKPGQSRYYMDPPASGSPPQNQHLRLVLDLSVTPIFEAGLWSIEDIVLYDHTFNTQTITRSQLEQLKFIKPLGGATGWDGTFTVKSNADETPPQLRSINVDKLSIDASGNTLDAQRTVTYTLDVSDDKSGINYFNFELKSPSGQQIQFEASYNATIISGNSLGGIWKLPVTLPRYAESGDWTVSDFTSYDQASNRMIPLTPAEIAAKGITSFNVRATPSDIRTPDLTSLSLSPSFVDTSISEQPITLTLGAKDDLAGLHLDFVSHSPNANENGVFVDYSSPGGAANSNSPSIRFLGFGFKNIGGNLNNGLWQATATLPRYSAAGTWYLKKVHLIDEAGNKKDLDEQKVKDLKLNIPTTFTVIQPSYDLDGTIPASGGTVADTVFGNRAQITVLPGSIPLPVEARIDVLNSDVHLPMPAGFSTNGTYFVNIDFTPHPTAPIPCPGLTLVLPIANQTKPGTVLTLYRVNSNGSLTPEPVCSGGVGVVKGTVNADQTSATFTGVGGLSTVVGLVPNSSVPGDLNNDNRVDCVDIAIVRAAMGKKGGDVGYDSRADVNHDSVVNIIDLSYVSRKLPAGQVCR